MMVHYHRDGGGRGGRPNVAAERTPQRRQTFDSYPSGMAVTVGLGYPFTPVQWEELERQAMIYKCMVANVPVPSELILPLTTDPQLSLSSGYTLKGGREDPEPGRCKRTDGKKWRCSRDAALDQKYCERHLNRGRPRSRKPVEVSVSASNKKSCHSHHLPSPSPSPSPCSVTTNPSSNYGVGGVAGRSSAPVFINGGFEHARSTSLFPHRESSGVDWLMIGGEPHLQHSQETLSTTPSYDNGRGNNLLNDCLFSLNSMEKQPDQNTETTRGFIDAWSDNAKHASSSTTETHEKDEEIHMGLGVTNWDYKGHPSWIGSSSWISSTQPGGPLGEVLHHRTSTPNSPSGVLQNKVGSLLDNSEKASVEPEITLQWFS